LPPSPRSKRKLGIRKAAAPKTRILVAEDDAVSRELIRARLVKWGYEVIAKEDGMGAMKELRKKDAPSLAILDWMMPGMDGLEVCRRVRAADRMLYIIVLTARNTKANVLEGIRAGANAYLIKPFDKDELHALILVGLRIIAIQAGLAERIKQLEAGRGGD
jgi:DNA-binding response OmpR family regulator